MAITLIEIVHVLVALFMILVVLVQGGNQGGVGAAFGGGNSSGVFGATGATSLLGKMTYGAALIFVCTSLLLTKMQGKGSDVGMKERLKQASGATPVETTKPVETNAAAPAAATDGSSKETAPQGSAAPAQTAPTQDAAQPASGATP